MTLARNGHVMRYVQHVIGLLRARYVHVIGVNEAEGGKAGTPELKPCLDLKYPSCGHSIPMNRQPVSLGPIVVATGSG